ncbi:MAG: hypothetical protein OEY89_07830 [Gammaproteobacteria bacterium]|nr:hypothetical protein [Gammaproteobacteria bacterium]
MRYNLMILFFLIFISGCQSPANMQQLETQNHTLQEQLRSASQKIEHLEIEKNKLNSEISEKNRVMGILDTEKSTLTNESTVLRGQLRSFVQQQIDHLKSFLLNNNLLDYIGGEQIRRTKYDNKPLMLVDIKNQVPQSGVLTGVGGYFAKPTTLIVKVMRNVNDNVVVIWESKVVTIDKTGLVKKNFPVNVGVEKGDIIGYYFPVLATVSFDEGTGDTRVTEDNPAPGKTVKLSSLDKTEQKRAYSLGVYALLK